MEGMIGAANAGLIFVGCVFQFLGVYENCWCQSSEIGLGNNAYIYFFSARNWPK
jgi:hypothetical protein